MFPALVRGAAQRRRGRLQHRLELSRNAHRRTSNAFFPSLPSFLFHSLFAGIVVVNVKKTGTNKLYEEYDVQKNLDTLHRVVTEARARRRRGETDTDTDPGGSSSSNNNLKDRWRADLQPRAAMRARTVPVLERERDSLRARLADVRVFFSSAAPLPTG